VIYIWVRRRVEWEDEDAFWAQVPERVKPRAELWNSTINMPFHVFRHRVREIAALNHSRIDKVTLAEWDEIPDGAKVVPVDDDDWFAPNLGEVLEREWRGERGIHWNPLWIGIPSDFGHWVYATRRALFPFSPPHWTCDTNNYGMVKGPGTKTLLEEHGLATDWFDGPGRDAVRRIHGRHSINNRTLGSQTSLRRTKRAGEIDRARLLRRLRRYRRLYRRPRWPAPAWAHPYLGMMAELMGEVEPR
jgi:hypothetical protein